MGNQSNEPLQPKAVVNMSPLRIRLKRRLYTVPDLLKITGATRKQITYWAQIGLVVPALRDSRGNGRSTSFYSMEEVVKALIVCELRRRFTLRQVRQVVGSLRQHETNLYKSEAYLLTDGYSVYYAFSDSEVIDVLKHQGQMALVLIHEQVAKLEAVA